MQVVQLACTGRAGSVMAGRWLHAAWRRWVVAGEACTSEAHTGGLGSVGEGETVAEGAAISAAADDPNLFLYA